MTVSKTDNWFKPILRSLV